MFLAAAQVATLILLLLAVFSICTFDPYEDRERNDQ